MYSKAVLYNLRYLGLVLSQLGQDFAVLLVIWLVLNLTFPRAIAYNFTPGAKFQRLFRDG
jgi:hypothetical protein